MTTSRREFVRLAALQGVALVVVIPQAGCRAGHAGVPWEPNQWIAISPDGVVTLVLDKSEMGQGVSTALPMIMAEELGADWDAVHVEHARPGPSFSDMGTAGSGSVMDGWRVQRTAAAAARELLITAAAMRWRVDPRECDTRDGAVVHRGSRRSLPFGDLVTDARVLPVPTDPSFRDRGAYRLLGTRVPDPAAVDIATGRQEFGIDTRRPGMLFATIARPPRHGARVRRFDATRAGAVSGVRHVVELPSGVAVIADTTWSALKGVAALAVEWDEDAASTFDNDAGWRLLSDAMARGGKVARASGDVRRALAGAARRIEAEYRWPWQAHAAIEPLNAVADVRDGRCEIWAGVQSPNGAQLLVSRALGIPPERVTVNVMRLGGGFGRRIANDFVVEAALASRAAGAPVQVVWTREDDFRHDMYNPAQLNRLVAGLDASGRLVAWDHRVSDFHLSMFGEFNPGFDPAAEGDPWGGFDSPYEVPDLRVELALTASPVPSGAWRSVTYPAAVMARECFLDEIAHATGVDPVALRRSLMPSSGVVQRGGVDVPNGDRLRHVLELAAREGGWGHPVPAPPGRRAGRGIACNPYHRGTMIAQVAEVSVGAAGDIRVHRIVSAVDCGQVINRLGVEKQVEGGVGWALSALLGPGVRFERGRTMTGSFGEYRPLRMAEMPVVETHIVDSAMRPFGMGEPPVPAVFPAVLNAVHAATGVRVRSLPVDPARLARA